MLKPRVNTKNRMNVSNKKKSLFRAISLGSIVLCIVIGTVYFSAPVFLEKKILPTLAEGCGFAHSRCEVRKFNLRKLDLASFQWGDPDSPAFIIDSARFDYSLYGLLNKQIDKITMSGVKIRAEYKDGGVFIPGLSLENVFKGSVNKNQEERLTSKKQILPVNFRECNIHNATLLFKVGSKDFIIPFEAQILPLNQKDITIGYDVCLWLYPRGETMLITGRFNIKEKALSFRFSRFSIISPFPAEIGMKENTCCTVKISQKGIDVEGGFYVNIDKEHAKRSLQFPFEPVHSIFLPVSFKGTVEKEHFWQFSLGLDSLSPAGVVQFYSPDGEFSFYPETLSVFGKGMGTDGSVQFTVKASDIGYSASFAKGHIPDLVVSGDVSIQNSQLKKIQAFAKLTDAQFNAGGLRAGKMNAMFPFRWPYPPGQKNESQRGGNGYLHVGEIQYSDRKLGTISSSLYQSGLGLTIAGRYKDFFQELGFDFSGTTGMGNDRGFFAKLDFKTTAPQKIVKLELGKIAPELKGVSFEGGIDLGGTCSFTNGTFTGTARTKIRNSKIEVPGKGMTLEGVDLDLNLRDIFRMCSFPGQIFKFKRFSWGSIETGEGEVVFQTESPKSFFLEKGEISWCGGHICTNAVRIEPEKKELDITLFCDRLRLATILKQFNAADATGEGTVNGRIPICINEGKIKFIDGFLYSTPGEGGTVRIQTNKLALGMPALSQQSIQMEIAGEALKNFTYDWAKLSLNSKGNDLLLLMQLDGKPSELMPFEFNKDEGLYKTKEKKRTRFKGIRFDINFRLPLDEMLHYGKGINDLLKNR